MIKEAILAHPEEARGGLSRPLIKKFLHTKHPATSKISEASFNNHISRAIKSGADKKTFTLPKGPSGKVKLSAAAKAAPKKKPAAKKPATKKPTVKKTAAKKKTTTAKKVRLLLCHVSLLSIANIIEPWLRPPPPPPPFSL